MLSNEIQDHYPSLSSQNIYGTSLTIFKWVSNVVASEILFQNLTARIGNCGSEYFFLLVNVRDLNLWIFQERRYKNIILTGTLGFFSACGAGRTSDSGWFQCLALYTAFVGDWKLKHNINVWRYPVHSSEIPSVKGGGL